MSTRSFARMKTKSSILLISGLLFLAFSTFAQTQIPLSVGIGLPLTPDEFSKFHDMGLCLGVGIDYPITSALTLAVRSSYNTFGLDKQAVINERHLYYFSENNIGGSGTSLITVQAGVSAMLNPNVQQVRPYLLARFGISHLSVDDITVLSGSGGAPPIAGHSETATSLVGGAGIIVPQGQTVDVYLEGQYSLAFTKARGTSFISILMGVLVKP